MPDDPTLTELRALRAQLNQMLANATTQAAIDFLNDWLAELNAKIAELEGH